jgi:hypothetical protein
MWPDSYGDMITTILNELRLLSKTNINIIHAVVRRNYHHFEVIRAKPKMAAPHGLQSDPGVQLLREHITPIPPISDPDFERQVGNFISQLVTGDDVRVVLIGDGSHGTSEFYTARAMMTRRLIEMHGFNIVAVEADWPDAEAVDRYVRHRPGPRASIDPATEAKRAGREPAFMRFPTCRLTSIPLTEECEY